MKDKLSDSKAQPDSTTPPSGCPMAYLWSAAAVRPFNHPDLQERLTDSKKKEKLKNFSKLKANEIVERVSYYKIYEVEFNALYQFYSCFTLFDHCNNLTQLIGIYDLIGGKIADFIRQGVITPCPEELKCGFEISKNMKKDLDFFQGAESLTEATKTQLQKLTGNKMTEKYLAHLAAEKCPYHLFGHFMVLLNLNSHGGFFGAAVGLVDICAENKIEVQTFMPGDEYKLQIRDPRKRVQNGTPGAQAFMSYRGKNYVVRKWINLVAEKDAVLPLIILGYQNCLNHLRDVYQEILDQSPVSKNYVKNISSLRSEGRLLFTPQDVKGFKSEGEESDLLVQIEWLAESAKHLSKFKEKGFNYIIALDSEIQASYSRLKSDDPESPYELADLPEGTLIISIIPEKNAKKSLKLSWLQDNREQSCKLLLAIDKVNSLENVALDSLVEQMVNALPSIKKASSLLGWVSSLFSKPDSTTAVSESSKTPVTEESQIPELEQVAGKKVAEKEGGEEVSKEGPKVNLSGRS